MLIEAASASPPWGWPVFFEGLGAALLGGLIAAGVALLVLRMQINADRAREQRRDDVRVAVLLQRTTLDLSSALTDPHWRVDRSDVDTASTGLWVAASEAFCQRPDDAALRAWVRNFQHELVRELDAYLGKDSKAKRSSADYARFVAWFNGASQAIASYLEHGADLPDLGSAGFAQPQRVTGGS